MKNSTKIIAGSAIGLGILYWINRDQVDSFIAEKKGDVTGKPATKDPNPSAGVERKPIATKPPKGGYVKPQTGGVKPSKPITDKPKPYNPPKETKPVKPVVTPQKPVRKVPEPQMPITRTPPDNSKPYTGKPIFTIDPIFDFDTNPIFKPTQPVVKDPIQNQPIRRTPVYSGGRSSGGRYSGGTGVISREDQDSRSNTRSYLRADGFGLNEELGI